MPAARSASEFRRTAAGIALFALAFGLCLADGALVRAPAPRRASPWKGFRVLLVEASIPEPMVLERLAAAGLKEIISESTQPVLVSNWSGLESMSLAQARSRLLPADPRYDSYLARMGQWFAASAGSLAYRAYYLRVGAQVRSGIDSSVDAALEGFAGRYRLPGAESTPGSLEHGSLPFAMALLALVATAGAGAFGRAKGGARGWRRLDKLAFRSSLILPWIALAGGGMDYAAIAALWGLALAALAESLYLPFEEFRHSGGFGAGFGSMLGRVRPLKLTTLAALASSLAFPKVLPSVCLLLAASLACTLGYASVASSSASRSRFIPLPISALRGRAFIKPGRVAAAETAVAAAIILAWAFVRVLAPDGSAQQPSALVYPSPDAIRGSPLPMPAEARSRAASETGSVLPGIAAFLEHRAIQEALPYVPIGEGRPDPFAAVSLPSPSGEGDRLVFDEEWAAFAYKSIPPLSIEGMLLEQDGATVGRSKAAEPPGAILARAGGHARQGLPLAPIASLRYIFDLVPPPGRQLVRAYREARMRAASGEQRQEA
jgi:hypothetical protein